MFESYIAYPSGTYLVAVVASLFYSFCIKKGKTAGRDEREYSQGVG